jgi:8-oxo-dGTP pyrophosphatase MutT (NUDIX family)
MRTEVYAVVVNEGGLVGLMARADGVGLPGGEFDLEESAEAALMRLVKESTDIDIAVGSLSGVYQKPQDGRLALVFRAEALSGDLGRLLWAAPGQWPEGLVGGTTLRVNDAVRAEGRTAFRLQ